MNTQTAKITAAQIPKQRKRHDPKPLVGFRIKVNRFFCACGQNHRTKRQFSGNCLAAS